MNGRAFGPLAASWVDAAPAEAGLIAADADGLAAAIYEAVERRMRGESFAVRFLIGDRRTAAARYLAPRVLETLHSFDERSATLRALAAETLTYGGVAQRDLIAYSTNLATGAGQLLRLADIVVVGSQIEAARLRALTEAPLARSVLFAPRDPVVPLPQSERMRPASVLIWAPDLAAADLSLEIFALQEARIPIEIVARESALNGLRCVQVAAADRSSALARARVVVDANVIHPGTACALAEWGIPLVAAAPGGAQEWLEGLFTYEPWNARSLWDAVMAALGAPPPRARSAHDGLEEMRATLVRERASVVRTGPLVSIVIPTFNRPEQLENALASVQAQTYEALDAIVVNDGGVAVADVVARYPRARLVDLPQNLGMTRALNTGIAQARGEYVTLLADDDRYAPDHVSRLVAALERSGASVANADEILRFSEPDGNGAWTITGHNVNGANAVSPSELLVRNPIVGPGVMVRRSALEAVGPFDTDVRHGSDFEMWMRLCAAYDFVHVDYATSLVNIRSDRSQLSAVSGADSAALAQRIFEKHPVGERPVLAAARAEFLASVATRPVLRDAPALRLSN